MKVLSMDEMKQVLGGLMAPIEPPEDGGGGTCCNCYCGPNASCYGECKFCNPAEGVRGPNGETSLCSKVKD